MSESGIAFAKPSMGEEEVARVAETIRSNWIVGGPQVREFEARVAAYCERAEGVAVTSWTTGAFLLLHAWGIGPGDEVLVPSLTFIASVNVVRHVGATPIFVEIDPETFNIDPEDAARKVTPRTRAVMPVDQIGLPCDMSAIEAIAARHGLQILADTACSLGSSYRGRPCGALGDAAVFSFHARKVVTTGEGGMIVTDDAALAARLRRLRHQGMSLSDFQRHSAPPTAFETYDEIGYNFRMTDLQGALGLVQMDRLPDMLAARRAAAAIYDAAFADHPQLVPARVLPECISNRQSYQLRLREGGAEARNALMDALFARGIPTRRGVMAAHREPVYRDSAPAMPATERVADTTLQLPMHASLSPSEAERVVAAVMDALDPAHEG